MSRLQCANNWGEMAAYAEKIQEAAEAFEAAADLLPVVTWHGLSRATREERLAEWTVIGMNAAACVTRVGRPDRAVELLEQSRSVLWRQSLHLRSDLTDLENAAPDLAQRLSQIRIALNAPTHPASETAVTATNIEIIRPPNSRTNLAHEWDKTLEDVRKLEGFGDYLQYASFRKLSAAASEGPVVILNESNHGSHALIAEPGGNIRSLDLPYLFRRDLVKHAQTMLNLQTPKRRLVRKKEILSILEWL